MIDRKKIKKSLKRMFSTATALTLCVTTSVYAAESDYDALDGTSPDKPEEYNYFTYYEGYNSDACYDMCKFYVHDDLVGCTSSLYLPNYDEYNEGLTYLVYHAYNDYVTFDSGKGIVYDEIILGDADTEEYTVTYDKLCGYRHSSGVFSSYVEYSASITLSHSFIPYKGYTVFLDGSTFINSDWNTTSISDVVDFSISTLYASRLYSDSLTFNRKTRELRVYDVDYICLWSGDMLGSFTKYCLSDADIENFTSDAALSTLDYVEDPYLVQCIFVALLTDGSIEQCSDAQLAALGVYRADRYDYDSDTNSCIPKDGASIRYDIPVPADVDVNVDDTTGAYEVIWDNFSIYATYPSVSMNLVMLYSGTVKVSVSGVSDAVFGVNSKTVGMPSNAKIINRILNVNDGVSFVTNANVNSALRTYYNISSDYSMVAQASEVHFLLRNFYYEESSSVYHFSNWVDVQIAVVENNGDVGYEITTREISPSATSDDIIQALEGGNSGTNADVGNADNVTGGEGDITYDGSSSYISVSDLDASDLLGYVDSGFGLLGDNGAFSIFSDVYSFMPASIWYVVICFIDVALIVAIVKILF